MLCSLLFASAAAFSLRLRSPTSVVYLLRQSLQRLPLLLPIGAGLSQPSSMQRRCRLGSLSLVASLLAQDLHLRPLVPPIGALFSHPGVAHSRSFRLFLKHAPQNLPDLPFTGALLVHPSVTHSRLRSASLLGFGSFLRFAGMPALREPSSSPVWQLSQ